MSFQTIIIAGHLGRDPEMRYTPAGQAVTNFNLAANRQYTDSRGQVVKETTWFRVSAWGKTAENCNQYLHKGSLVLVEGRLVCDPESPAALDKVFDVAANEVTVAVGPEGGWIGIFPKFHIGRVIVMAPIVDVDADLTVE